MMILALIRDERERRRVCRALPAGIEIRYCHDEREIEALLASGHPNALLLETRNHSGASTLALVQRLRVHYPLLPVIVYCALATLSATVAQDLLDAGRSGASSVVTANSSDLRGDIRAALEDCQRERRARETADVIVRLVPPEMRSIVEQCLAEPRRHRTVAGLAATLGTATKTLARRMARAGLPRPRRMIAWTRLLAAASLLENPRRPIGSVAKELGFTTSRSFRELMEHYTGRRPSALRGTGAFGTVLHDFQCDVTRSEVVNPKGPRARARSRWQ
jgi:AraC-like DNA-binding protein